MEIISVIVRTRLAELMNLRESVRFRATARVAIAQRMSGLYFPASELMPSSNEQSGLDAASCGAQNQRLAALATNLG